MEKRKLIEKLKEHGLNDYSLMVELENNQEVTQEFIDDMLDGTSYQEKKILIKIFDELQEEVKEVKRKNGNGKGKEVKEGKKENGNEKLNKDGLFNRAIEKPLVLNKVKYKRIPVTHITGIEINRLYNYFDFTAEKGADNFTFEVICDTGREYSVVSVLDHKTYHITKRDMIRIIKNKMLFELIEI